jgi:hypothetical protein
MTTKPDDTDGGGGQPEQCGHQCVPSLVQFGPSASWPVVLVPIGAPGIIDAGVDR